MTARFEDIEALVWQTGTRDRMLVARIMRAVSDYARAADCPPEPEQRAAILLATVWPPREPPPEEWTAEGHEIGWGPL